MPLRVPIAVAHGDGIGPEIMAVTLRALEACGAQVRLHPIEVGEKVYRSGETSGIPPAAWDVLRETKVLLKAPITTPQGGGYKSLNVTIRKTLGLFANVRPCVSYHPFVKTKHPGMDVVIVRENEEDLYAGIEHRQTEDVYQCLKLITRPGSEKIIRYAFEYAVVNGRKKVTCLSKDNIMKLTDGLFHKVFDEIGAEFPQIEKDHLIIDIGAARLADTPEMFDVIVMPNLYGDILSDVAAQITGSVGLGGSANIGDQVAMFEAIHGSAPMIAGQGIANPSGILLAAVMMLVHIGQPEEAATLHNAWLRTIEEGIHTGDIYREGTSRERVGTDSFGDALIARMGKLPETLAPVHYGGPEAACILMPKWKPGPPKKKELVGVDLFFMERDPNPEALALKVKPLEGDGLSLQMITNRGVKVWPGGMPETFCTDHWRCRFVGEAVSQAQIVSLMGRAVAAGLDMIKMETLCTFDGEAGFSLGQGQ